MLGLQYFSFNDLWSPLFLALMIILAALYFVLIGPIAEKVKDSKNTRTSQKVMFLSGMLILYMAQGGPISLLGHTMFTFHMLSMALSYIVAPPLIMRGIPAWVWRKVLDYKPIRWFSFLAHPIVAALLFNGLFSFYHIPVIHDYVMLNFAVHRIYYIVLFITAMLMWGSLVHPVPERDRGSGLHKLGFIFLNMVLLTPACGLIIFASEPIYETYSNPNVWATAMGYCVSDNTQLLLQKFGGPSYFNFLTTTQQDQQVGGIVMKMFQELIFGVMLAYVFFQWYRKENKEDDDPIPAVQVTGRSEA
ncbi:cytochrome c oxidase assembly factor CtaG [Neobacillus mesonae]|nr:cytochrome c oxidase assembly factor CtaG [Neobacillus mesonae]